MDPEAYFAPIDLPGYEMLIFAPRGTGRSSPPSSPEGYRINGYVADLESLRTHLGLDRLTLYGNSYGGSVALAYACAHPGRVERFVISNAVVRVDAQFEEAVGQARRRFAEIFPDAAERLAAADQADAASETEPTRAEAQRAFRTRMACSVAREGPDETAYLDRLCSAPNNREAVAGMWVEWREGLDLLQGAAAATAPALVIGSEADIVCPPATVWPIASSLPNARYVEVAGTGHFVAVEASELFREHIAEFLNQ
jgi:proline iminopeptidase